MSDKRRGLGRGLGALIPTAPGRPEVDTDESAAAAPASADKRPAPPAAPSPPPTPAGPTKFGDAVSAWVVGSGAPEAAEGTEGLTAVDGAYFAELPIDAITPNPKQPRTVFDQEAMDELVHSIQEVGLLQPVVVRSVDEGYELIMGERRWRASRLAGLEMIPAIIRDTADDDLLRDALLENLHRSQLNPLEEAAAYDQLLQDFGCTHEELAQRIGRSRPQISNTLRLLKLPAGVQRRVAAGVLSAGHARALLAIDSAEEQDHLAHRIVAEGLSVRAVEEIVAMGETGVPSKGKGTRAKSPVAPGLDDLAQRLSDRLETRVKVQMGRTRGKITIDVATMEDLDRVVALLEQD
jgi:ParB family chromosome partitioning protein